MHLTGVAAQQAFAYAQQLFGGTGDDGYTYDEYGNIERVDNRGGAEYDVLYDIGAKGGWRFESGILGQLAEDLGKDRGTNAVGSKRQAIRDTDSVDDMARLFIILADRTDVEWSLSVGEYNGIRNKLGIMTWGNRIRTGTSPFKVDGLKVHIHSHPAKEVEQNLPG